MCGRFYVDDDTLREIEKIVKSIDAKRAKRGEVHPSEPAVVLCAAKEASGASALSAAQTLTAAVMDWGYEMRGTGKLMFNARSETVKERPMFRTDYEACRCVIPVKKFYEWKRVSAKEKEKYEFMEPGQILYLAGIYRKDPDGGRFAILTKGATGCMEGIHDRMPVILEKKDIEEWILSKEEADRLLGCSFEWLQREKSDFTEYEQLRLF